MSKAAAALPSALWVSQALDWELTKVPKAERQSMLRLMQVFSEHSDRPELPDEAVLRRSFKSLAASHIQTMQENAHLRHYIEDLEATVAAERNKADGDKLQSRGELTTAKVAAANSAKLVDEWKKRCMGWKRNCMEMEKKYKRIAALAQRKLKIMDDGKPRPDLDLPETSEADAVMDRISDVPKAKPKTKARPAEKRVFRLGDDIDPPKSFGQKPDGSRYGAKFSSSHRFGAGSKVSGAPGELSMSWHTTSRSDSERRPPRGVGRRPWKDPNSSVGEEHSARVTDNLETVAALHKQGQLSEDEYLRAKETILSLAMQNDDLTLESFISAARSGSPTPQRPQTVPEPSGVSRSINGAGADERSRTTKKEPIDAVKAKATLKVFKEELSELPFENVGEFWVFFDTGADHLNKVQLAKGLKLLGLGHHNLDEIVFACTGLDTPNARIESRPFLKHFAWKGGKLPDVVNQAEKILYEAKLNRKKIIARAMGKELPKVAMATATGEADPFASLVQGGDATGRESVSHTGESAPVHVDPEKAKAALTEVVAHFSKCGFANVAEAFAVINENGDNFITRGGMTKALQHLRIDHINVDEVLFAAHGGESEHETSAAHDPTESHPHFRKIEFKQFMKHFTWKGGAAGKDSEKTLYDARVKRKEILRRTAQPLEAIEAAGAPWPQEEINKLLGLVKADGVGAWEEKAKDLGTGRSAEEVKEFHAHLA